MNFRRFILGNLVTAARRGKVTFIRATESFAGPRSIGWIGAFCMLGTIRRALREWPRFCRQRKILPPSFWKSGSLWSHFLRMQHERQITTSLSLLYDRLGSPPWQDRFSIRGAPPHRRPEFISKPCVLAFLHTGVYPVIRYWLRSQGAKAVIMVYDIPTLLTLFAQPIFATGDSRFGLEETPHFFLYSRDLRRAIQFFRPGTILLVALDGGIDKGSFSAHHTREGVLHLGNGAARLATRCGASLMPVGARRTRAGLFEISFGETVDDRLLQEKSYSEATGQLLDFLWPQVQANPEDVTVGLMEAFRSRDTESPKL